MFSNCKICLSSSRPIRVENFADHYRMMSADSDFRFSEEFEELKHVGRDQACTAADLPCNRPKNRFTNILPYDHSRFKLQPVDDEEGSDYINANYVPVSLNSVMIWSFKRLTSLCTFNNFLQVNLHLNHRPSLVFSGSQFPEGVHSDSRTVALHKRRLLENGLGEQQSSDRYANSLHREG